MKVPFLKPEPEKKATCRYCGSEYAFTESNRHLLLPFMCWRCTAAANAEFERLQINRRRKRIPFIRL